MATILQFVPPPVSGSIRRGPVDDGGQVVIFPGVRYERREAEFDTGDNSPDGPVASSPKRRAK